MGMQEFYKIFDNLIEDYYPSWVASISKVTLLRVVNGKATCFVVIDDFVSGFQGTAVISFFLLTSPHHPQNLNLEWRNHNG